MSVNSGHGALKRARKDLLACWDETKQDWRDENRRHFEEQVLTPLLARLRTAEAAMGHMEAVLNKIRVDCG